MMRLALSIALFALAIVASWSHWRGPIRWTPDALFYESQRFELAGDTAQEARRRVFGGAAGEQVKRENPLVRSNTWVNESARFYRRRWFVPAMAAAISPFFGDRSILFVSLTAYLSLGVLLFLLLRRRFPDWASAVAAGGSLLLLPLREWSFAPLTDSTGLALFIMALLIAPYAATGGFGSVLLWFTAVLALAFTRDTAAILLVACAVMFALTRTRRWLVLLAASAVAALVPALIFTLPVREEIAYTLNGYRPVDSPTWTYILAHYPRAAWAYLYSDAAWVVDHPVYGFAFILGVLVSIVAVLAEKADLWPMAVLVGAVVFLFSNPNRTEFRLELVLLPIVAFGFAVCLTTAQSVVTRRALSVRGP